MENRNLAVGFFDSGIGGLSVLRTASILLPKENYIYYGDSAHAPYGERTEQEIKRLTRDGVNVLLDMGIKALVVACNTATSVAIEMLRQDLDIPVVGMEPAVKPAIIRADGGKILVMATQATLKLPKFGKLVERLNAEDEIIPLPCVGLAQLVENGDEKGIERYLRERVAPYAGKVAAVVLGCTHYVFCRDQIQRILGNTPVVDGNVGTVHQLERMLISCDLLNEKNKKGIIRYVSSRGEEHAKTFCKFLVDTD